MTRVFTEAEAFAWAYEVAGLGKPEFAGSSGGQPDWKVREVWIEATTISNSDFENAEWKQARLTAAKRGGTPTRIGPVQPTSDAFLRKFDYHEKDALKKGDHQERSGQLIIFVCVNVDASVDVDEAFDALELDARSVVQQNPGTVVVLVRRVTGRCGVT